MAFRCKRYRIREIPYTGAARWWFGDKGFIIQRRRFVFLWTHQPVPLVYVDVPFGWVNQSVFLNYEDAVDVLTGWLRVTGQPDDYTIERG